MGVIRPYVRQVLAGTNWLDDYLVYDRHSVVGVHGLIWQLRERQADAVLLLTNSFSTGMFAWLSGAPLRVGFALHGRRLLLTHPLYAPRSGGRRIPSSAIDHYLEVVGVLGCTTTCKTPELATTDEEEQAADRVWHRFGWEPAQPVALLNTGGAYGAAKAWPAEHFAKLARRLVTEHGLRVLFLCGPAERACVARICHDVRHPDVQSLAQEKLSVGLSKACVRRSRIMVTTDSGPRHFAAAFGVPAVTIFGPTDPRWSHNYAPAAIDLQLDVDCGPCARRVCPWEHHRCMRDLTVDQVAVAAASLLAATRREQAA